MDHQSLHVVILAAGQGSRMYSRLPKVLHPLGSQTLLHHVVDTAQQLAEQVTVVYGHQGERIRQALDDYTLNWVYQSEQLGTGHAVQQALPFIKPHEQVLVLYGDVPLIKVETLRGLINNHDEQGVSWLTAYVNQPDGLGRILRDYSNQPIAIIEEKDASTQQKQINEVNTGICLFDARFLQNHLPELDNDNQQREYYLTDLFATALTSGKTINTYELSGDVYEIQGVNTRGDLAKLERYWQLCLAQDLLDRGLTLKDYKRVDLRGELNFGYDCTVDINVILEGHNQIGDDCYIGPNCHLKNVQLGNGVIIQDHSVIEGCVIGDHCQVGPFARVRPGTHFENKVKVGNFVEVKDSHFQAGSKANHLSYLGNSSLGRDVNIGAGTITCNYDGAHKHTTTIEDNAFIGSLTALVAPIRIGSGATIGAGSTLSKDAPAGQLTLARAKPVTIEHWRRPQKDS